MTTTWKKSGDSGLAHAVDRKGDSCFATLCNVALRADAAQDAELGDERCAGCLAAQKNTFGKDGNQ